MTRRSRSSDKDAIAKGILLFLLIGYTALANFWSSLTTQEKWIFGILGGSAFVVLLTIIIVFVRYRKQKRRNAWQNAMKNWSTNVRGGKIPQFNSAEDLAPMALEKLALQVYKQMGYRASLTEVSGDHGIDVRLIDPNGQIELVQCKQWNRPVGEPEVRDLMGAIVHEKAIKGYVWAPRGFSWSAKQWAKGKPIMLMDNDDIGRLVESVYSN